MLAQGDSFPAKKKKKKFWTALKAETENQKRAWHVSGRDQVVWLTPAVWERTVEGVTLERQARAQFSSMLCWGIWILSRRQWEAIVSIKVLE